MAPLLSVLAYLIVIKVGLDSIFGERRDFYLSMNNSLNANFWIVAVVIIFCFFIFARRIARSPNGGALTAIVDLSVANTLTALLSLLVAPIAGRIIINSDVMQIFALSYKGIKRSAFYWVAISLLCAFQFYRLCELYVHGSDFFITFHSDFL